MALILLLYVTGLVGSTFVGRRPIALLQRLLFRVPLVSIIYSASKQLVESFSGKSATGFKRVVVIEYPRPGIWSMGFLTGPHVRRGAPPFGNRLHPHSAYA